MIFLKIRERIAEECERASPFSACEVEVDESYFGARRVRGKRGRGAFGKTIVFGIFKRNGCVYTEIVPDCKKRTLQAIMRGRIALDAVINSDGGRGYDGLVDVGYAKHFRVHHGQDEFVQGTHHVNGIESFWSFAKRRLQKWERFKLNESKTDQVSRIIRDTVDAGKIKTEDPNPSKRYAKYIPFWV
jgi:transposase